MSIIALKINNTKMKKKSNLLSSALILGAIIFFSGCGKYEDGPSLTLRTKTARVAGDWELTALWYNNENILSSSYSDYYYCIDGFQVPYSTNTNMEINWTFERDGKWDYEITTTGQTLNWNLTYETCNAFYDNANDTEVDKGTWEFDSDKESIIISFDNGSYKEIWDIIELREKQMKLEMIEDGDKIEMTLEKK
jgi:hypothetical protein